MKQIVCRIQEAKVAALMDEFVERVQRKVAIEDALLECTGLCTNCGAKSDDLIHRGKRHMLCLKCDNYIQGEDLRESKLTRAQLEALQNDPANHHHLRLTFECGHTQTCRCSASKTRYQVEGRCPACHMGLHESSDSGDTKRVGIVAVFRRTGGKLKVLMGKRDYDPEAGKYALPGGHVKEGETTEEGARREISEETGITVKKLTQLRVRPGDDGETVTLYGTLYTGEEKAEADDETGAVRWMDVANLPDGLAWDNNELIPKLAKEMELTEGALVNRAKDFLAPKDPQVYRDAADKFFKTIDQWTYNRASTADDIWQAAEWVIHQCGAKEYSDSNFSKLGREMFMLHLVMKVLEELKTWKEAWSGLVIKLKANESSPIDVKRFILRTPTFTFKQTQFTGWQVFVNTTHAGPWPQPIGCVEQDPEGGWFIVMGRKLGDRWAWWDTGWEKGENGGVAGPRFETKEQAGLEIWHNYRKAMHNRPVSLR